MANQQGRQVDTPGAFTDQPQLPSSVPGLPQDEGALGAAVQRTGMQLEGTIGPIADRLTVDEAKQAGGLAGLDPDWRPTGDPTLRGVAFDTAAQDTYVNQLQAGTRDAVAKAYDTWNQLPEDQRTPGALQQSLSTIHDNALANDVFPSIRPRWEQMFSQLSYPWLEKAQLTHETYVDNQAKASAQGNITSLQDNALRAASIGTPDGDALMGSEQAALGRMLDDQVRRGLMTPEAAEKQRAALTQSLLSTNLLARFDAIQDPAQRQAMLENFSKSYGTGTSGLVNPLFGVRGATSGARNNNFTNIGDGAFAQSQPGYAGADGRFARFSTPEAGLKAADANLQSYGRQGIDTIAGVVSRWSPPSENDTPALIANMSRRLGIAPNQRLDMSDPTVRARLVGALVQQEGAAPFGPAQVVGALSGNPTNGLDPQSFSYVQGKMTAAVNADAQAAQQQATAGALELNKAFDQEKKGFAVAPDVYQSLQAKYGSSTDPKVMAALTSLQQMHVNAARWAAMGNPAAVEADLAKQTPPRQDGTPRVDVPYLEAGRAYVKQLREDLASDPMARAARDGVIPPPQAIDFSRPATIAAGLQARAPAAAQVAQRYGTDPTMLLPGEKAQLKQLSAQGGQPMLDAARAIVTSLPPGAAGRLFDSVGGDAPAFATAGRVAAWNGSPSFLQDYAERWRLAQDPATRKGMELPERNQTDQVVNDTLGDALSQIPSMNAAVRQAARDVYEKRALDQNLDKQLAQPGAQTVFARGLQEAAGATFDAQGQQYGGVGSLRNQGYFGGTQKVLAPLDMKADRVGDALASLTDADYAKLPAPPVAGDGKTPIAADRLAGANLFSLGHGVYQIALGSRADPQWVRQPNGQRFVLDLNQMEPALRARLPDAYRTP